MSDTVKVDILQVDTSKSQQSVAGLRSEIKALKDQLVGLDEGTKEYNETLLELGNKTHQLKEIQEQVRRTTSDFGDTLSNVRGTIGGLSGAFQTVLGSLSLMGVEIGDDVKMLKLLQSAMAITQGVAAIDSGVKAFKALTISIRASAVAMKGLRAAIIATGIGALVVAVGELIAHFDDVVNFFKGANDAAEDLDTTIANLNRDIEAMGELAEQKLALFEARASHTAKEVRDEELRLQDETINKLKEKNEEYLHAMLYSKKKADREAAEEQYRVTSEALAKAQQNRTKLYQRNYAADIKENRIAEEKKAEDARAAWKKAMEQRKADLQKIAEQDNTANMSLLGDEQAELLKLQMAYDEAIELHKKYGQDTTAITEAYKAQQAEIIAKYDKQRKDAKLEELNTAQHEAELQAETEYQLRKAEIILANEENADEQLIELDMQYRDRREELLRESYEKGLVTTEDFNNQIAALEVEAANLQIEQEERVTQKTQEQLEKRKKLQQNYAKAIGSITDSVASILGSIGSTLEQGSEEWKNVMTAQAIISTIKGSIDAYMGMIQAIPGPAGIAAGALAAIATATAGWAEIKKIQETEISTSGSSAGGSTSALGNVNSGAVSVLSTQVTNTRAVQTEDDISELPDTRVYVLESDITTAQRHVSVTNQNATY